MGSVTIQAVTGDITKETTEVIVNSSNEKFSLKTGSIKIFFYTSHLFDISLISHKTRYLLLSSSFLGVSKAILEAAGQTVEDECQTLGKNIYTIHLCSCTIVYFTVFKEKLQFFIGISINVLANILIFYFCLVSSKH